MNNDLEKWNFKLFISNAMYQSSWRLHKEILELSMILEALTQTLYRSGIERQRKPKKGAKDRAPERETKLQFH